MSARELPPEPLPSRVVRLAPEWSKSQHTRNPQDQPSSTPKSRPHPSASLRGSRGRSQGRSLEWEKRRRFEVIFPFASAQTHVELLPAAPPGLRPGCLYGESMPVSSEEAQITQHLLVGLSVCYFLRGRI